MSEKSYFPAPALHRVPAFVSDGTNSQSQSELRREKPTFWVHWTLPMDAILKDSHIHV